MKGFSTFTAVLAMLLFGVATVYLALCGLHTAQAKVFNMEYFGLFMLAIGAGLFMVFIHAISSALHAQAQRKEFEQRAGDPRHNLKDWTN